MARLDATQELASLEEERCRRPPALLPRRVFDSEEERCRAGVILFVNALRCHRGRCFGVVATRHLGPYPDGRAHGGHQDDRPERREEKPRPEVAQFDPECAGGAL